MGLLFERFAQDKCCLCGSDQNLTGEHKVKASALRAEFGRDTMLIGRVGEPGGMRLAQGPKSKEFHFSARVCGVCNSTATQRADLEFDRFHALAKGLLANGQEPRGAFEEARYKLGSEPYLDVFRYFAKLLCCHMAEVGAPRPVLLSQFALGRIAQNFIWLSVDEDWTYQRLSAQFGPHQYAAHGGLVVYGDRKSGSPNAFHSTLTIGPLRYTFNSRLNWLQRLELRIAHADFYDWCRKKVEEAKLDPIPRTEQYRLGLAAEPTESASAEEENSTGP